MAKVFKTALMSIAFLSYSFIESKDVVVIRFPIIVSIIHLSLIGWPLLSVVSKSYYVHTILILYITEQL